MGCLSLALHHGPPGKLKAIAAAIYRKPPTAEQLGFWGMTYRDWEAEQQPVEIWPENVPAYKLWCKVGSQWRYTMSGPASLDYIPLQHELDRMGLSEEDYDALFSDIRVMESEALAAMRND